MDRLGLVIWILLLLAVFNTAIVGIEVFTVVTGTHGSLMVFSFTGEKPAQDPLGFYLQHAVFVAPVNWIVVFGVWIWRGKLRSAWTKTGFDRDVFRLLTRMRGGETRRNILRSLSVPKDRFQLARELGLDWKTITKQIQNLMKYGLVSEQIAYGRVKLYGLTPMGRNLLVLLDDQGDEGIERQNASNHVVTDTTPSA